MRKAVEPSGEDVKKLKSGIKRKGWGSNRGVGLIRKQKRKKRKKRKRWETSVVMQ